MQLKYIIRRAIAGIVIVPATAVIYFIGYALLVGAGATPTATPQAVWQFGLEIGVFLTLILMFWEGINNLLNKIGE